MRALAFLLVACAPAVEPDPVDTDPPPVDVCINEYMARNAQSLDVDGDFPDWLELHNPGDEAVDLDGWGLSDDATTPFDALLVDIELAPGGFLLLYADGKPELGELHLPFKLSGDGEQIALTAPSGAGEVVDFGVMLDDFAFARETDCCEGACWAAVRDGTPGSSNSTAPD